MSDRFHPLSMEQLVDWAFVELERRGSIFGVPRRSVFTPRADHPFRRREHGLELETPWGVAAGPQTQMAQNIVAAWLAGARLIELKTIQTLDELEVNKPCIDVQDEGYNVEWSQELRVHQSFDEYLRAWVLIHALHRALGFPGERPGVRFDMSVGYDLAGVQRPNVTWYLDAMADASAWLPRYVEIVARRFPAIRETDVPARLSNSVTLSTMHGCPPDEIERISRYLIDERGLHTSVKCNPTLLGAERVRGIVNGDLGWTDVPIPDEAFGHDLRYVDAVPMFQRLRAAAAERGLGFGLKLSNTLEVRNWRGVFERDATMYMSGRALHAVTVNLAATVADEFAGALPLSFAGGADAFNMARLLAGGLRSVTVCSDLLKTGGYLRLLQYPEQVEAAFAAVGARDIDDFVLRTARSDGSGDVSLGEAARFNLRRYAAAVRHERRYRRDAFRTDRSKTMRVLGAFDCIEPPCVDECPVDQAVPRYMSAVRSGDLAEAVRVTRLDNPLPAILGRVCDHLCEATCIRSHLDEPLAIRHIKRFITEQEPHVAARMAVAGRADGSPRVAVIGAGPAGLAAAEWLARSGLGVTIFEEHPYPGGMVGGAIPAYRLPQERIDQDLAVLERLGVEVRYGQRAGVDVSVDGLRGQGFAAILVAVGAQRGKRLGLPGEDAAGVLDGVEFLRGVREGRPAPIGPRVGVIGAGDTAMDCARSARRVGATSVQVIYRRTVDQMPADREEIHELREEGIEVLELSRPVGLRIADGRLAGLTCLRTAYRGRRDPAGRKVVVDVPGSEFEVALDTLILAISQAPVLDLFGAERPRLTPEGYLACDPATLESSIPGVYAAGDVAAHGPASIVRAAADGKRAARAIAVSLGGGADVPPPSAAYRADAALDMHALTVRRAHREYRVPVRTTDAHQRGGFDETVLGYTPEEARREASRCLDCDVLCSLCVGVCPNLALVTYEATPRRWALPALELREGAVHVAGPGDAAGAGGAAGRFGIEQRFQVAVLTDLCNECGTCVTACPTAGRPYVDKPRLYLDAVDFEAQAGNAFRIRDADHIEGRFDGATHRLAVGHGPDEGRLVYQAPGLRVVLDRASFGLTEAAAEGSAADGPRSLEPAAIMASLLDGIAGSLPHLPMPGVPGEDGTRVPEPALAS
jgi:putative selenate reductase